MSEEKLEKMLNELVEATSEPAPSYLSEEIKRQIPRDLSQHRVGLGNISIIINLRVSKLAAAAAIVITLILFANFFWGRGQESGGILRSGKLLVEYLGGPDRSNVLAAKSRYEYLAQTGKAVVYYGDIVDPRDTSAVLIQWKLPDGRYRVVFGDLREETVSAEDIILLQARMLRKNAK
ncbi:MAG: hypothetical protein JW947_10760 [Sedimentisphaerales bacterium]|nr:hypothetical protein [Sedimentisphaerales bacterium]